MSRRHYVHMMYASVVKSTLSVDCLQELSIIQRGTIALMYLYIFFKAAMYTKTLDAAIWNTPAVLIRVCWHASESDFIFAVASHHQSSRFAVNHIYVPIHQCIQHRLQNTLGEPVSFYLHALIRRVPCPFRMMTSSNGNISRVSGPLCGEFTGHRWIPLTKASNAEPSYFLSSVPE